VGAWRGLRGWFLGRRYRCEGIRFGMEMEKFTVKYICIYFFSCYNEKISYQVAVLSLHLDLYSLVLQQ
jgi:hypothetical protein